MTEQAAGRRHQDDLAALALLQHLRRCGAGHERNRHQLDLATACVELARVRVGPALDHMDRDADELLKQIAASVCEEAALRSS